MTTRSSLNPSYTHLDPAIPPAYLRRMIVSTLHRKGAEGAEAGVIAEMERLLERHVQHLFETARDYAALANRATPNHHDLLLAQDETSHVAGSLRRESKRRRKGRKANVIKKEDDEAEKTERGDPYPRSPLIKGIKLETRASSAEPTFPETLTSLAETIREWPSTPMSEDEAVVEGSGRLDHAFEGAPELPPKWTYPPPPHPVDPPAPAKVTSAALNFVKATVADADVDPELGVVHYRATKRAR